MPNMVVAWLCTPPGEGVKKFLYIILLNSKVCKRKIAIKLFELRNDVDTIGSDKVVVVHSHLI